MKKERESNIELLRILTIIGVIVLHYNNKAIGGAFEFVQYKSLNFYVLYIFESIFICAVNVFIIISGYFLCNTEKRDFWKVIKLLVQVIVICEFKYIVSIIINNNRITAKGILLHFIPANYFVILYIVVYILSPYINILIKSIDKKEFKRLVFILFILFSLYPTAIDLLSEITNRQYIGLSSVGMYGSQYGYSVVNFILCYIIGAYISRFKNELKKLKVSKLLVLFGGITLCITLWALFNDYTGYAQEKSALEYCNPLVIINAVIIIILFMKINLETNTIINKIARASFMVFLFHDVFMKRLKIEIFVNKNLFIMIFHLIISTVVIYSVCFIMFIIYEKIEKIVFRYLESKIKLVYEVKKQENIGEKI